MLVHASRNITIDLRILSLRELIPHEETIPRLFDTVRRDLDMSGYMRDPLIVDPELKIILDGMHRQAALRSMGANFALCACFRYLDSSTILQRWLRYMISPDSKILTALIDLFNLEKTSNSNLAMSAVDSGESAIALLSRKQSYISKAEYDVHTVYEKLKESDRLAADRNIEVEFHPEKEHETLPLSGAVSVLYPMAIKKHDVINIASSHKLFPYKTTRHIVRVRPMGICFPLGLLKQNSIDDCKTRLLQIMREGSFDLMPPDSWYEGRRYSESLAVFKEKSDSK